MSRYPPEPPRMQPEFYYKSEDEYFNELAKPRELRRQQRKHLLEQNSLLKSLPLYPMRDRDEYRYRDKNGNRYALREDYRYPIRERDVINRYHVDYIHKLEDDYEAYNAKKDYYYRDFDKHNDAKKHQYEDRKCQKLRFYEEDYYPPPDHHPPQHQHQPNYNTTRSEPPYVSLTHQHEHHHRKIDRRRRDRLRPRSVDMYEEPSPRDHRVHMHIGPHEHIHAHKSSRAIPSMNYDRLHCPYCATNVQNKDDVIAYPWTVANEPIKRRKTTSLPPLYPMTIIDQSVAEDDSLTKITTKTVAAKRQNDIFEKRLANLEKQQQLKREAAAKDNLGSVHNEYTDDNKENNNSQIKNNTIVGLQEADIKSKAGSKARSVIDTAIAKSHVSKAKSQIVSSASQAAPKEDDAVAKDVAKARSKVSIGINAPSKVSIGVQYSRAPSTRIRPLFGTREHAVGGRGTYTKREYGYQPPPIRESIEDDVVPDDSISNVRVPPMRFNDRDYPHEHYRHRGDIRALTEVDEDYPRDRYFESVRVSGPMMAPPTPPPVQERLPQRDGRVFRGEYYDRHAKRWYSYDVNVGARDVYGERRPKREVYR